MLSECKVESSNEGNEFVYELGLDFVLVSVPNAVEDALSDLLEVNIRDVGLGFQPSQRRWYLLAA